MANKEDRKNNPNGIIFGNILNEDAVGNEGRSRQHTGADKEAQQKFDAGKQTKNEL